MFRHNYTHVSHSAFWIHQVVCWKYRTGNDKAWTVEVSVPAICWFTRESGLVIITHIVLWLINNSITVCWRLSLVSKRTPGCWQSVAGPVPRSANWALLISAKRRWKFDVGGNFLFVYPHCNTPSRVPAAMMQASPSRSICLFLFVKQFMAPLIIFFYRIFTQTLWPARACAQLHLLPYPCGSKSRQYCYSMNSATLDCHCLGKQPA